MCSYSCTYYVMSVCVYVRTSPKGPRWLCEAPGRRRCKKRHFEKGFWCFLSIHARIVFSRHIFVHLPWEQSKTHLELGSFLSTVINLNFIELLYVIAILTILLKDVNMQFHKSLVVICWYKRVAFGIFILPELSILIEEKKKALFQKSQHSTLTWNQL